MRYFYNPGFSGGSTFYWQLMDAGSHERESLTLKYDVCFADNFDFGEKGRVINKLRIPQNYKKKVFFKFFFQRFLFTSFFFKSFFKSFFFQKFLFTGFFFKSFFHNCSIFYRIQAWLGDL